MKIAVHNIKMRNRPKDSLMPVDYNLDFKLEPERIIDIEAFLRRRYLSPYCIDFAKKLVCFVETSPNIDLFEAPVYYKVQYEQAKKVYLMPFKAFLSLKYDTIENKKSVLIYSVGRCGSTLLSKIFHNISGICSISEPDVYMQIYLLRRKNAINRNESSRLINNLTAFFWRSTDFDITNLLVIKFRSQVIKIHRDLSNAMPNSKIIFIYRNAIDVIQSYDRILGYPYTRRRWILRFPFISWLYKARKKRYYSRSINLHGEYKKILRKGSPLDIVNNLGHCGIFLLDWLSKVNSYLELKKYRSDTVALRYEDLIANPREMIRVIFAYCGISNEEIDNAYKALSIDAHAGTKLARNATPKYKLDKKDHIRIRKVIKRYTQFDDSDVVLPGTIELN
jgi:hypothetical protein